MIRMAGLITGLRVLRWHWIFHCRLRFASAVIGI